ncbi:type I-D CRISPR-associated protein Cas10d/Csc3 [Aerosakkonema sp. BLCC-F183]|uniref:type I-D CRISPR-associated protein Cas10d/Csc3 n=1 Tax=Aerosakkonema sp. BLCC-F183 TaxID=3342834 RepID=UPI0035B80695
MTTLLQTLLIETLPEDTDPILRSYIETILPAMEREFALITALGGSYQGHYQKLVRQSNFRADETAQRWSNKADQSLLVHVLNGLLTAWNLSQYLPEELQLSEVEKRLLCLGITLHDYNKAVQGQKEETAPPKASEIPQILQVCETWGEKLNFDAFWDEWREYLLDIAYLAQNTQFKIGSNTVISNWEIGDFEVKIDDDRRLDLPLRHLLAFGDIAVHCSDPADVAIQTGGDRLQERLESLEINKKLVYHRLRDCRGLLTNQIHNAVVNFVRKIDWQPILYFANGAVYLAPPNSVAPSLDEIETAVWDSLIKGDRSQNQKGLADYFSTGDVGFVRDGKGLKVAPQTLELFSPAELIRQLPDVVKAKVANAKSPATPKRIEKLEIADDEKKRLLKTADLRADRIAEFLILAQREFFEECQEYAPQILAMLNLETDISPAETTVQSGGVNYGWYRVAAAYMAANSTLDLEQVADFLTDFADRLATWAENNGFLKQNSSPTRAAFTSYLAQYLEVWGLTESPREFENELAAYADAKVNNQAICSLSSGEFSPEDQLDSVVLFKPQQYSNKNALGGGRIKRGISKIWSLEMLLRQAYWSAPAGKLEDRQPIFLYIFPAYVYSPQTAKAVKLLTKELQRMNLWEVRKHWLDAEMQVSGLHHLAWRDEDEDEAEAGRFGKHQYSVRDLPFMAMTYTTTMGKTITDAWVEPTFLALALPRLLGVKVVATASQDPLYASDKEFLETVKLDGAAGFWNLLGLDSSLRLDNLQNALERLLIAYSIHLDNRSAKPDARWQAFNGTVRDLATDVLNVFAIANESLRRDKREPSPKEVDRYWNFAQIWSQGDVNMEKKMKFTQDLVKKYRQFYQVDLKESSHAILLPITKALEVILSSPNDLDPEDLILQGAGQLHDALDRQEVYKRPLLKDKSVDYSLRQQQELEAIHAFMTTCVQEIFLGQYKGDRALLQENRNRIKAGAEFAYRWLHIQEKQQSQSEGNK